MEEKRTFLFDLDGTLYDSKGLKKRVVLAAILSPKRLRLLIAERVTRKELSKSDTGTVGYDALFKGMSEVTHYPLDEVIAWYYGWYMPEIAYVLKKHHTPRPGVLERIEKLKAEGCRVAVLSDYGNIENKLKALGIDPGLFDALFDAPSLGGFKPASCVFTTACQYLGCKPEDTIMVGDREDTDGGSAAAGIRFLNIKDFLL